MQVSFHLPGFLRQFADGQSVASIEVSGSTVGEALSVLWVAYPGLRDRVMTETGEVRQHVNIFVKDESIRFTGGLATSLPADCDVWIIPAVSGGARFRTT